MGPDHRVFLTNTQTDEVRALDLLDARVLRRELWPTDVYMHRHVWEQTQAWVRACLLAVDAQRSVWSAGAVTEAVEGADPAAVTRISEHGYDPLAA